MVLTLVNENGERGEKGERSVENAESDVQQKTIVHLKDRTPCDK